jgi:polar amino acid transport system substrate-binding protein
MRSFASDDLPMTATEIAKMEDGFPNPSFLRGHGLTIADRCSRIIDGVGRPSCTQSRPLSTTRHPSFWLFAWLALLIPSVGRGAEPGGLRWGGDQEGGAPYIYTEADNLEKLIGFEVDLMQAVALKLSQKPTFVQCQWDQMLLELGRENIDLAVNGYEFTPDRARKYLASVPYYIYEVQLCARKDGPIHGWEILEKLKPDGTRWKLAVLEASAADRYVTERFGDSCLIQRYTGTAECLQLVETQQIDVTVQDLPALQYYIEEQQRFPDLHNVGHPQAPGYYVMYARAEQKPLIEAVNNAIRELHDSGEMRQIYARYYLWNKTQEQLPKIWKTWKSELSVGDEHKWRDLRQQVIPLIKAAGITVLLSVLSMPLAMLIGQFAALARTWHTPALGGSGRHEVGLAPILNVIATIYVEIVRGTPLAFQLIVIYFVLPVFGVTIPSFWAGVIALAINYSAYEAEIMRLGLQAIPRGQIEAALSLGMPRTMAIRRVVLPQAIRLVIPATANDFIALFKDTAVCSVISVQELSKQYSMGAKTTGYFLEMAAMASILYLLMSYPLSLLAAWLERRLKRD